MTETQKALAKGGHLHGDNFTGSGNAFAPRFALIRQMCQFGTLDADYVEIVPTFA